MPNERRKEYRSTGAPVTSTGRDELHHSFGTAGLSLCMISGAVSIKELNRRGFLQNMTARSPRLFGRSLAEEPLGDGQGR